MYDKWSANSNLIWRFFTEWIDRECCPRILWDILRQRDFYCVYLYGRLSHIVWPSSIKLLFHHYLLNYSQHQYEIYSKGALANQKSSGHAYFTWTPNLTCSKLDFDAEASLNLACNCSFVSIFQALILGSKYVHKRCRTHLWMFSVFWH